MLLHCCCGPCASACVPRLKADGHEVTLFFANSNIDTPEEFERRKTAAQRLAEVDGVDFVAAPYDHAAWRNEAAAGFEQEPERGLRCARCFRFSLRECARYAAEHGYEGFCSSLTVSPHKVSATVFAAGRDCETATTRFAPYDFKKKQGFLVSVRRTADLGLYRQTYCGCEFSRRDRFLKRGKCGSDRIDRIGVTENPGNPVNPVEKKKRCALRVLMERSSIPLDLFTKETSHVPKK